MKASLFVFMVVLVDGVSGEGCLCTDKFRVLYGIDVAWKQIDNAFKHRDDIKFPVYGLYFNLIKELDLVEPIAKYDSLDKHPVWDPFVKKLTERMEEKPPRRVVLDDTQVEHLQPFVKLYTCIFNRKLNCLLGIASAVREIEDKVFFNSQAPDILYDFLMTLVDMLGLRPALQKIEEIDLYAMCDTFTGKVEAQLRSLNQVDDEIVKECEADPRKLPRIQYTPTNRSAEDKRYDRDSDPAMKHEQEKYLESLNIPAQ